MSKIIEYKHHGVMVKVDENLKGRHREYCLCYRCRLFKPEDMNINCSIAIFNFMLDCVANITTPVWECSKFEEKK